LKRLAKISWPQGGFGLARRRPGVFLSGVWRDDDYLCHVNDTQAMGMARPCTTHRRRGRSGRRHRTAGGFIGDDIPRLETSKSLSNMRRSYMRVPLDPKRDRCRGRRAMALPQRFGLCQHLPNNLERRFFPLVLSGRSRTPFTDFVPLWPSVAGSYHRETSRRES